MKTTLLLLAATVTLAAPAARAAEDLPLLTLDEALQGAGKNNPDLAVLREKAVQAGTIAEKAWVLVKPQINAGINYQRNNTEQKLAFPDFSTFKITGINPETGAPIIDLKMMDMVIQQLNSWSGQFTVVQPLVNLRALPQIRNAQAAGKIAELSTEQVRREVLFGVAAAYYGIAGLQEALALSERNVAQFGEHERDARARLAQGTTPRVAVLRAEIDRRRAEEDLVRARYGLMAARRSLGLAVGRDTLFRVEAPPPPTAEPGDEAALVKKAVDARPDVKAAREGLEVARRGLQDIWLKFAPTLNAQFVMRYTDAKGFSDTNWPWFIGVGLSIPLYDGGVRYAELHENESKVREAESQLKSATNKTTDEVVRARLDLLSALANLEKAKALVELAREGAVAVKAGYDNGMASYIEVSDSNTQLNAAESSVLIEAVNVQISALRLAKAVGDFQP